MQVIDFVKGIGYSVIQFPDGEKHLKINELNRKDTVDIRCRIKSSDDLFLLMQLSDILNRQCIEVENITIYYLMSMRCDRLFSFEQPFTLQIVANVINSFKAKQVDIYEPHSERCLSLINNSKSISLPEIRCFIGPFLCYPDSGACKRYSSIIYSPNPTICSKKRDVESGKLLGFKIEKEGYWSKRLCVVDDLCDGGGTFCGVAELLRNELKVEHLTLVVTHAVQRKGIERVASVFDKVIITNTYEDWDNLPKNVRVVNVLK